MIVIFSASTIVDSFSQSFTWNIDCKLTIIFNELMRKPRMLNSHQENRFSPKHAYKTPANSHHINAPIFLTPNHQRTRISQFTQSLSDTFLKLQFTRPHSSIVVILSKQCTLL